MSDQQLGVLIDAWLKDTDSPPSDVGRSTAQIESRLPRTRQRTRRWPLHPLDYLPTSKAGRSPAGGFSMFSAVKFVAAGAIAALFGGFVLASVLTTQQGDGVVPAAVSESPATTVASDATATDTAFFEGVAAYGQQVTPGKITYEDDGTTRSVGATYRMELTEMSDPRLNGTFQIKWNEVTYDGIHNVVTASNRIDNEHGSWIGIERGYQHPGRGWAWQGLYQGHGAYEGLSALLFWEDGPSTTAFGIVFPGEMPEPLDAPEPASE